MVKVIKKFNKDGLNMLYRLRSTDSIELNHYGEWIHLYEMTNDIISSEIHYFKYCLKINAKVYNNLYIWIEILENINILKRKVKIEKIIHTNKCNVICEKGNIK